MIKVSFKKSIYFIAVIGLLIFFHYTNILKPVESALAIVLNPVLNKLYAFSSDIRIYYDKQTDKRDLSSLVDQLRVQVNQLIEENARLKSMEEENKNLRGYLKFLSTKEKRYVMANIITKGEADTANQTLMIDKGSKEGLVNGLAVISSEGNMVGKIISTKDHQAELCLITSSRCQTAAAIQNKDKTIGIAQGDLGLTIKMNFIPQSEKIKVGDIVITSGLEMNIPRGLVIGQVSQVVQENNELWQNAKIEPLSDFNELIIISVLLP